MRSVVCSLIAVFTVSIVGAQPPSVPDTPAGSVGKQVDPWFKKKEKPKNTTIRDLSGAVLTPDRQPVAGALVRLRDTSTGNTRDMIADAKGVYKFTGLKRDLIYQVSAEYKGSKSNTRSLTPFDERDEPILDLTMAPAQAASKNPPPKESKK